MSTQRVILICGMAAVMACFPGAGGAQTLPADRVPPAVRQSFETRFPGAQEVEWELESDKNYEAEFELNGAETTARFDASGKWLETEAVVRRSRLPQPVNAAIVKAFPQYRISGARSLAAWNSPDVIYEIHVENAREIVEVQFAADGRLLNRSAKSKPAK